MVDLESLLQQLELTVRTGKKSLFSDAVTIDPNEVYRIVAAIRDNLPELMREAHTVVANKDNIIKEEQRKAESIIHNAEAKAQEIIAEAKEYALQSISENEIVKLATEQADAIKKDAIEFSTRVKAEAVDNVTALFGNTAVFLKKELDETMQALELAKKFNPKK